MSYQEVKNYVSLISTLCIFGGYSTYVFLNNRDDIWHSTASLSFWGAVVLILIPVSIVAKKVVTTLFIIIYRSVTKEQEPSFADELDKLIGLKASRVSYLLPDFCWACARWRWSGRSPGRSSSLSLPASWPRWLTASRSFICIGKEFSMEKLQINNYIRKLRFERDEMSQQQLADLVGVTRQTIISIEKGNYSPSLELAFRIAEVFDLPIEQVFYIDK